jgi:hypothetical protein
MSSNVPNTAPDTVDIRQASEYLGLAPQTVLSNIHRGRISAQKVGVKGKWIMDIGEIRRFEVDRRSVGRPAFLLEKFIAENSAVLQTSDQQDLFRQLVDAETIKKQKTLPGWKPRTRWLNTMIKKYFG